LHSADDDDDDDDAVFARRCLIADS